MLYGEAARTSDGDAIYDERLATMQLHEQPCAQTLS